jgi:hypothetical protein
MAHGTPRPSARSSCAVAECDPTPLGVRPAVPLATRTFAPHRPRVHRRRANPRIWLPLAQHASVAARHRLWRVARTATSAPSPCAIQRAARSPHAARRARRAAARLSSSPARRRFPHDRPCRIVQMHSKQLLLETPAAYIGTLLVDSSAIDGRPCCSPRTTSRAQHASYTPDGCSASHARSSSSF